MSILFCFLFSFAISFFGSIPPGPINSNVLFLVVERKYRQAWYFAFGGTFPELFLAFFAAYLQAYIIAFPQIYRVVSIVFAIILFIMGTVIFFKKIQTNSAVGDKSAGTSNWATLLKGMVLITFNPLTVPFWLGIFIFFQTLWANFNTFPMQLSAGLGAFIGAFTLNGVLIKLGSLPFVKNALQPSRTLNRVIGFSYYSLALYQLYNTFKS